MDTRPLSSRYLLPAALAMFIICGFMVTPIAAAEDVSNIDTNVTVICTTHDGIPIGHAQATVSILTTVSGQKHPVRHDYRGTTNALGEAHMHIVQRIDRRHTTVYLTVTCSGYYDYHAYSAFVPTEKTKDWLMRAVLDTRDVLHPPCKYITSPVSQITRY